ncbi:hypothetical protein PLICRDRAFT_46703 [Plicaturopsis crispa FD-325 SS-3]|uniref:Aldehyde dehydrogenase domain-containing protein n=1 Tax=Plicaturopsis crispa FD-325 SS-3 TaxID=944288 RepID=A0A0C9T3M8_PLICR|nr:hypothetical protein PLICRDRAFT_46703 [Plicaturopsis crispa FD-325 SS-3]
MSRTFTYKFDTPTYKGVSSFDVGLFIDGQFVDSVDKETIDVVNPANGNVLTSVTAGSAKDVDIAVQAAKKAYKSTWGLRAPGARRARLLNKLADLIEQNGDELAALEALDVGKPYRSARLFDVGGIVSTLRYYAGWADKIQGKTIETTEKKLAYTRHEPIGVVGQIIPWNFPMMMLSWKIGPALACGNCIVLKPSELTPLTTLRIASLINEAGFPPGVVNFVNGYGHTVGDAITTHPGIGKVAFTGSTVTGRKVLEAAARSNLKNVILELGGKSPSIIFDDADLDVVIPWTGHGIYLNQGQACSASSRLYVQEGIYDEFIKRFTAFSEAITIGDPFDGATKHGPQASKAQFEKILGYIESGKSEGAKVQYGGNRHGTEGYFIQPTIFTECKPHMKIVREEIFGPVAVVSKFKTEEEAIELANDSNYGLASSIFSTNINTAIRVAHAIEAGTAWVNCANFPEPYIPTGGFKQSGIGRELGEYALANYTEVKAVHVNLGLQMR